MATIKSYTDLEQSKVLATILPIESADYCWGIDYESRYLNFNSIPYTRPYIWYNDEDNIPCWSLAALLGVLPNIIKGVHFKTLSFLYEWHCAYMNGNGEILNCDTSADNPIDACYEMILKLHELNLL